ncbi:unnamed protein product [Victoria cruziana]
MAFRCHHIPPPTPGWHGT